MNHNTLAELLKATGRADVIALATMGRRAVLGSTGEYELFQLRGGPRGAVDWADLSDRASVMPRDTVGRFVSLAGFEVTLTRRIAAAPVV